MSDDEREYSEEEEEEEEEEGEQEFNLHLPQGLRATEAEKLQRRLRSLS